MGEFLCILKKNNSKINIDFTSTYFGKIKMN